MRLKEFLRKFAEDKEFAAKYKAVPSLDEALAQANNDGFDITKEEAVAALYSTNSPNGGELTNVELASVAGCKPDSDALCPNCYSADMNYYFDIFPGYSVYQCSRCGWYRKDRVANPDHCWACGSKLITVRTFSRSVEIKCNSCGEALYID